MYVTSNAGVTWELRGNVGPVLISSLALSSNGQIRYGYVAGSFAGPLYTSGNSGQTWTRQRDAGVIHWRDIVCSSNGINAVATSATSRSIIRTTNAGATWNEVLSGSVFQQAPALAASSDLRVIVAAPFNRFIWTSTDFGDTWTEQTGSGQRNWGLVACSADGSQIIASISNQNIQASSDFGVTWNTQLNLTQFPVVLRMSEDGRVRLVGTSQGGTIRFSRNFGQTWSSTSGPTFVDGGSCSADGSVLIIYGRVVSATQIPTTFISTNAGLTWTSISDSMLSTVLRDGSEILATLGIQGFTTAYRNGLLRGGVGTSSNPTYSFINDNTTGWYLPSNGNLGISTAGVERMRVDPSGNVGIGITAPTFQLQLSTDSAAKPTSSAWTVSSDERIKLNIEDANVTTCYDTVKSLKLRRFEWDPSWNSDIEDRHAIGFIAQEVKDYFPKAVRIRNADGFHSLDMDQIYKTMYGAIQHAIKRVDVLTEDISALESK
jgi:photosystem II stability/assembly factor-like uncharacterized protein